MTDFNQPKQNVDTQFNITRSNINLTDPSARSARRAEISKEIVNVEIALIRLEREIKELKGQYTELWEEDDTHGMTQPPSRVRPDGLGLEFEWKEGYVSPDEWIPLPQLMDDVSRERQERLKQTRIKLEDKMAELTALQRHLSILRDEFDSLKDTTN